MFSVIIPAYNCERTIYQVLESVINQTRFDLIEEIVIVNDGSSDNTDEIIKCYISAHPDVNFNYITQDNHGVSYARNVGIKKAKGEWIALLDSDDLWLPQKIEKQYDAINKNDKILFLGSSYPLKIYFRMYENGIFNITPKQLCFRNLPSTPSVIFNKAVGIELGLFDENMRYGEDINFFQKFLKKHSYYILVEDLIRISIGKKFFASTGLSSNLHEMHKGRNQNTRELYEMGLISYSYMVFMLALNEIKYIRRRMIKTILQCKEKIDR